MKKGGKGWKGAGILTNTHFEVDMKFKADIVTFDPSDDEYIAYAFFRSKDSSDKHYLALSRCLEPGNEGIATLELDDQVRVTPNGVKRWRLDESRLILDLEPEAAENLALDGSPTIIVDFSVAPDSREGLKEALAAILAGSPERDELP